MTEKHRSVNNVLWRVVSGRIRRGRGPDAARGPPVGHSCYKQSGKGVGKFEVSPTLSANFVNFGTQTA